MKTRFTPLVKVKKNDMDRCERELQLAHENALSARKALEEAYEELHRTSTPTEGTVASLQQSRAILEAQRTLIVQRQEWTAFAQRQEELARDALSQAVVEYEKFKYLEAEEIKAEQQRLKRREAHTMDELAMQAFNHKKEGE